MTESTSTATYPPKSKGRTDWTPEKRAGLLETVIIAGSKAIDVEKVAADVSGSCVLSGWADPNSARGLKVLGDRSTQT